MKREKRRNGDGVMGRQKNFEIWIAEFKIFENRDFPSKTFRIPKKEEKQCGEYRTQLYRDSAKSLFQFSTMFQQLLKKA
jgi:hypothetical protein